MQEPLTLVLHILISTSIRFSLSMGSALIVLFTYVKSIYMVHLSWCTFAFSSGNIFLMMSKIGYCIVKKFVLDFQSIVITKCCSMCTNLCGECWHIFSIFIAEFQDFLVLWNPFIISKYVVLKLKSAFRHVNNFLLLKTNFWNLNSKSTLK